MLTRAMRSYASNSPTNRSLEPYGQA